MKYLLAIPTLAAALLLGAATPARATTSTHTYYTCSYRVPVAKLVGTITLTLSGADVTPAACRQVNSTMHGTRAYGRPPGAVLGIWIAYDAQIRVTVWGTSRVYGEAFCDRFDQEIADQFNRVR